MCSNCLHRKVCKYRDGFERMNIEVPPMLEDVVEITTRCKLLMDERAWQMIRPRGCD